MPLSCMAHAESASCEPALLTCKGAGMPSRSARLAHERPHGAAERDRGLHVDVQHLVDRRVGHVQDEPRRRVDRRIGHKRVHAAVAVARQRRQALQVRRRADVRGAADRLDAARAQVAQRLVHVGLRAHGWVGAERAARGALSAMCHVPAAWVV
jgi:hypothetical protein